MTNVDRLLRGIPVLAVICLFEQPPWAGESIGKAIKDGKVKIDLRYRYEHVDEDPFERNANASTIRLRLGYETARFYGFSAHAAFEGIYALDDCYNSTENGKTDLPVVADPEGVETDQIWLAYRAPAKTDLVLGRQAINRLNQRYVGTVAWRQNQQTFDAFSATGRPTKKLDFFYGHVNNVNRIFGEDNPNEVLADTDMSTDLADASYRFGIGTLSAYAYFLEFEDAPSRSNRNLGVRFAGSLGVAEKTKLIYTAEYADQAAYKDAPPTVDAEYGLLKFGVDFRGITFLAGYELLGGDGIYGFQTPLATLHKFNGWADRFLVTPATGLQDLWLSVSGMVAGVRLQAVYHDFDFDEGGSSYGGEWNLAAVRTWYKRYTVGVKYAKYETDLTPGPSPALSDFDSEKFWIWLQLKI